MKISKLFVILLILFSPSCNNTNIESDNMMVKTSKALIVIDGLEYEANIFDSEVSEELIKHFPLNMDMQELHNNEKYYYLDYSLPSNPKQIEKIEKGDIMLYQDNCIVIFYKSFDTNYKYTKIGHIDNLGEIGSENVNVLIKEKE